MSPDTRRKPGAKESGAYNASVEKPPWVPATSVSSLPGIAWVWTGSRDQNVQGPSAVQGHLISALHLPVSWCIMLFTYKLWNHPNSRKLWRDGNDGSTCKSHRDIVRSVTAFHVHLDKSWRMENILTHWARKSQIHTGPVELNQLFLYFWDFCMYGSHFPGTNDFCPYLL